MTLNITQGLPYAIQWRLPNGKNLWGTLESFEVRSQLRKTKLNTSPLISNLHSFMTKSYGVDAQANDIIVELRLTGAETREISSSGFFDLILSDPGVDDEKGLKIYSDKVKLYTLTTLPEGDL